MGTNCSNLSYVDSNISEYVWKNLGPRCVETNVQILTFIIYGIILFLGTVGNVCTCIVIIRNKCMHTATNYYLFSLAISDMIMLCLGLPFELYSSLCTQYPYNLPEFICKGRAFLTELTSYASILTITAFSAERWLAICFPLKVQLFSKFSRAIKVIYAVWIVACISAGPMAVFVKINRLNFPYNETEPQYRLLKMNVSDDSQTIRYTDFCSLDFYNPEASSAVINWSFWTFFITPLTIITVLYVHIAIKIREASDYLKNQSAECISRAEQRSIRTRQSLLRMLKSSSAAMRLRKYYVWACKPKFLDNQLSSTNFETDEGTRKISVRNLIAVVLAFFICWLPFHAQRMMVVYLDMANIDVTTQRLYSLIYYVSGYCYYANSAVNPIIYNILSRKFRRAFLRTICPKLLVLRLGFLTTTDTRYEKSPTPVPMKDARVSSTNRGRRDTRNSMPCASSTHTNLTDNKCLLTANGEENIQMTTQV